MCIYKFGVIKNDQDEQYIYPDIWSREITSNYSRLMIAPAKNQIDLMLKLAESFEGPYGILYALLISRNDNKCGRYQCPKPLSIDELKEFCQVFKEYLETDGRHHFWVASTKVKDLLVYDQNNVIFAYGDNDIKKRILLDQGLKEEKVNFPYPHTHLYNPENDDFENKILSYFDWLYAPLQDGDAY